MTQGAELRRRRKMSKYHWSQVWIFTTWIFTGAMADLESCGGYLRVKRASIPPRGVITSPNHPRNYGPLTNCIWLIEVDEDRTIDITVDTVLGESSSDNECVDYLEVRSGSETAGLLLLTCNTSVSQSVTSAGRFLWVHFYADSTNHFPGFSLTWSWNDNKGSQGFNPIKGCSETMFKCANRECISWSYVCDGVNDCGCSSPGDEDYRQCIQPEMDRGVKLAIGTSVGSGVLITIVVVVGIWEHIQQERRRKTNARYERKPMKRADVNFLQVQLDLRRQSVQKTPHLEQRRNAFVLGIDPIPQDWAEGTEPEKSKPEVSPKPEIRKPPPSRHRPPSKTPPPSKPATVAKTEPAKRASALPPVKPKVAMKVKIEKPKVIRKVSKPKETVSTKAKQRPPVSDQNESHARRGRTLENTHL